MFPGQQQEQGLRNRLLQGQILGQDMQNRQLQDAIQNAPRPIPPGYIGPVIEQGNLANAAREGAGAARTLANIWEQAGTFDPVRNPEIQGTATYAAMGTVPILQQMLNSGTLNEGEMDAFSGLIGDLTPRHLSPEGLAALRAVDLQALPIVPQGRLAFAAPPLRRSGPLDEALRARIASALALAPGDIVDHQWVDNGPGWCAVRLPSADAVAQVRVDGSRLGEIKLGLVGFHPAGSEALYEVRALFSGIEDPVTGSLNASLAQWLIGSGAAPRRYLATQGRTLERDGRVHIEQLGDTVWVGGDVASCIVGEVQL